MLSWQFYMLIYNNIISSPDSVGDCRKARAIYRGIVLFEFQNILLHGYAKI